jgi:hypothetical protein
MNEVKFFNLSERITNWSQQKIIKASLFDATCEDDIFKLSSYTSLMRILERYNPDKYKSCTCLEEADVELIYEWLCERLPVVKFARNMPCKTIIRGTQLCLQFSLKSCGINMDISELENIRAVVRVNGEEYQVFDYLEETLTEVEYGVVAFLLDTIQLPNGLLTVTIEILENEIWNTVSEITIGNLNV